MLYYIFMVGGGRLDRTPTRNTWQKETMMRSYPEAKTDRIDNRTAAELYAEPVPGFDQAEIDQMAAERRERRARLRAARGGK